MMLFLFVFIGASSGSTAGGLKTARIAILSRYFYNGLLKMIHPRVVMPVKFDSGSLSDEGLNSIILVVISFVLVVTGCTVALSLIGMSPSVALSASITTITNTGPGVGQLGPYGSFASLDPLGKIILIFSMWTGRLEVMTVLVLFSPVFWKEMIRHRPKN
jgi:trk system potassium uptake protein TrkH